MRQGAGVPDELLHLLVGPLWVASHLVPSGQHLRRLRGSAGASRRCRLGPASTSSRSESGRSRQRSGRRARSGSLALPDGVINAGIAGGFRDRCTVGDVVVCSREDYADVGPRGRLALFRFPAASSWCATSRPMRRCCSGRLPRRPHPGDRRSRRDLARDRHPARPRVRWRAGVSLSLRRRVDGRFRGVARGAAGRRAGDRDSRRVEPRR